jgi:hypothetical protein
MRERPQDFYFSASEARGEYFAGTRFSTIAEYRSRDSVIWATEVTAPGVKPVSHSKDLLCVGRNLRARFVGRAWAKPGDMWSAVKKEA